MLSFNNYVVISLTCNNTISLSWMSMLCLYYTVMCCDTCMTSPNPQTFPPKSWFGGVTHWYNCLDWVVYPLLNCLKVGCHCWKLVVFIGNKLWCSEWSEGGNFTSFWQIIVQELCRQDKEVILNEPWLGKRRIMVTHRGMLDLHSSPLSEGRRSDETCIFCYNRSTEGCDWGNMDFLWIV